MVRSFRKVNRYSWIMIHNLVRCWNGL